MNKIEKIKAELKKRYQPPSSKAALTKFQQLLTTLNTTNKLLEECLDFFADDPEAMVRRQATTSKPEDSTKFIDSMANDLGLIQEEFTNLERNLADMRTRSIEIMMSLSMRRAAAVAGQERRCAETNLPLVA